MTAKTADIAVFVVGDRRLLCSVIALAVDAMDGIRVVGHDRDVSGAGPVDVFLVDLDTPAFEPAVRAAAESQAVAITKRLCRDRSGARIVVMADLEQWDAVAEAIRGGATGVISKAADIAEVEQAIRGVARGALYISADHAGTLKKAMGSRPHVATRQERLRTLSSRELQVMLLIADGESTPQIARALEISPKTVAQHKANITKKLGLRTARDLQIYMGRRKELAATVTAV